MSTLFPTVPQPRCTVCLIKCGRRQSQPGLTCTFYLSFCLSEEFKCVMNKGVVIWNIIPLHWWNYKDGESSQIMLIVFYHERCPCWGCGARRKGRPGMNSDSTVKGLGACSTAWILCTSLCWKMQKELCCCCCCCLSSSAQDEHIMEKLGGKTEVGGNETDMFFR